MIEHLFIQWKIHGDGGEDERVQHSNATPHQGFPGKSFRSSRR